MKFREFILSSGTKIILGRNAENNDELVDAAKRNDFLLHTAAPGSPFCNAGNKPSKEDINESAIICARYSQDWRDNKKDVIVHGFLKADTYKRKDMKKGTWGVKKQKKIKVKKEEIAKL